MKAFAGMRSFLILWGGQVFSLFGTAMSGFTLAIWAWQMTNQVTALALVAFFQFAPSLLLSPLTGALVDRWNRKWVLVISDVASGVATLAILLLYLSGRLQIWHFYITGAFSGAFQAFQWPAYSATITLLVPKAQYVRASGMRSLAESAATIAGPILAGFLLGIIGLAGILAVDLVTLFVALGALVLVRIPQPKRSAEGEAGRGNLWQESLYGFRYLRARKSLLGMLLLFLVYNLLAVFGFTAMIPMLLARTGNNAALLGTVQSVAGIGGAVGGLLLSAWGGPKRRIHGVLLGMASTSALGITLIGLGRTLDVWLAAAFFAALLAPITNGSIDAIWQAKVAPDVQGRVFAVRRQIAQLTVPVALLLAGPLSDRVFEPGMAKGGWLVPAFGWLVGTGAGAGMSLMLVLAGLLGAAVALLAYAVPVVRDIELLLPDHETAQSTPQMIRMDSDG